MQLSTVKYTLLLTLAVLVIAAFTETWVGARLRDAATRLRDHPRLEFVYREARQVVEARLGQFASFLAPLGVSAVVASPKDAPEAILRAELRPVIMARKKSSFESIGLTALREVITDFGGDAANIAADAEITDPLTRQLLHFDALYNESGVRVGFDFQSLKSSIYPNPFHFSKAEFDALRAREDAKTLAAARAGVTLISIPYTTDRCERDSREESGWVHIAGLSADDRKARIKRHILSELTFRASGSA